MGGRTEEGLKKNETHRPDVNDLHAELKQLTLLQSPAASYIIILRLTLLAVCGMNELPMKMNPTPVLISNPKLA